uniref:Bromo domain-containing protein n=1 Tax=Kalanchoe fedtschenkoi TaxID=63787 RepID=A0A7N0U5L5_KALFE
MGKVVVERRRKKKGRPSLLDLQKRRIKEQAELEQQFQLKHKKSSPNSNTPITGRRSTRRNSLRESSDEDEENEDDDEKPAPGRRQKKKKKLGRGSARREKSDSEGEDDVEEEEEEDVGRNLKKRKINAIADGSGSAEIRKVEKLASGGTNSHTNQGTVVDDGNGTPLPDKKLLVFILDRLQKKDSYGVFSEPVDPEELPDYHEVIKHPMDFSTVRKKLDGGAYGNLEEFEDDVFLICSNAMQYNAPDTVYFKQARSIQELAEKSFDNLRRDSDEDDEQEPKRRGRPPAKHKKPLGRPLDHAGSESASGATLAAGRESTMWSNYDLRKGSPAEKTGPRDSVGRSRLIPGNSDAYNSWWLLQQKLDKNDDYSGSQLRGGYNKQGKKPVTFTENRRDTYKQFHPSVAVNNSSVFSTFDVEKKMLLPVGLHAEYGYARSLARFAAGLGPLAWNIASKKIEKSLPSEVKFGPGWVGHNDVNPQRPMLIYPSSSGQAAAAPSVSAHSALKISGDKSTNQQEGDNSLGYQLASTIALDCQPATAVAMPMPSGDGASQSSEVDKVSPETWGHLSKSSVCATGQRPSFQYQQQGPTMQIGMNRGVNLQPQLTQLNMQQKMNQHHLQPQISQHNLQPQMSLYNLQSQMNQHAGPQLRIPTGFNHNYLQTANLVSRASTDVTHPVLGNCSSAGDGTNHFLTNRSTPSVASSSNPASDTVTGASRMQFHPEPTSGAFTQQQKQVSVPPDLNVQFQSPGSPSSSRLDSKHPDLALQL